MSQPHRTQCLIFVVYKDGSEEADRTLERSNIEAFCLLPNPVKRRHPDVVALLLQNGVEVIGVTGEYPSSFAAMRGSKVEVFEVLLDETGAVHGSKFQPPEPLHIAVGPGSRKLAKLLLPNDIIIHPLKIVDIKCVQTAIDDSNFEVMDVILSLGADIRYRSGSGATFLHFAVVHGHEALVRSLLNHGANVNAAEKDGSTPLHVAVANNNVQIAKELILRGANVNAVKEGGSTPLHIAATVDDVQITKDLIEHGANVNAMTDDGSTPLHVAATEGDVQITRYLTEHGANINAMTDDGSTPLHIAATENNVQMTKELIELGANVDAMTKDESTPLFIAADNDFVRTAKELVKHGANVNAVTTDGCTPLHSAAIKGYLQIVKGLVKHGADVNARLLTGPQAGCTPLHGAVLAQRLRIAKRLLDSGSSVDAEFIGGNTSLLIAVEKRCLESIQLLLTYRPDVNNVNNKKALFHALVKSNVHSKYKQIAKALFVYGFSVHPEQKLDIRVLRGAVCADLLELVQGLISDGANIHAQYPGGKSLLHIAAKHAGPDMISLLLDSGAYVDSLDDSRRTPVFDAIRALSLTNLAYLKERDASLSCTDVNGLTPLHVACLSNKGGSKIVEFLLQHGVNINAKCNAGNTPLFYAVQRATPLVSLILVMYGAHFDFADRILPEVYEVFARRPDLFRLILEYYFFDPQLFGELWERFNSAPRDQYSHNSFCSCKRMIRHLGFKLTVATMHTYEGSKLDWFRKAKGSFISRYEAELEVMKTARVGMTDVTYHDILTKSPGQIARYLNNKAVAQEFKSNNSIKKFKVYGRILRAKLLKGNLRKALLVQGIKAYSSLFQSYAELPLEIQEKPLGYLSNEEIRNLLLVCNLTHIKFDPIMYGLFYHKK